MEQILGRELSLTEVEDRLVMNFAEVFQIKEVSEEIAEISAKV